MPRSPEVAAKIRAWRQEHPFIRTMRPSPRRNTRQNAPPSALILTSAVEWVLPWKKDTYPTQPQGLTELFEHTYAWTTIAHWLKGSVAIRPAAARTLSDFIRARCARGLAIADALDAEVAARPVKAPFGKAPNIPRHLRLPEEN